MTKRDLIALRILFTAARASGDLRTVMPWPDSLHLTTLESLRAERILAVYPRVRAMPLVQLTVRGRVLGLREKLRERRIVTRLLPPATSTYARGAMTLWRLRRYCDDRCICSLWPFWRLCPICDGGAA